MNAYVPVVKIKEIYSHPYSDNLDILTFDGLLWKCFVTKNKFKPGDIVIYIPINSIIPNSLISKFNIIPLRKSNLIKVIKFKEFISYGVVIPNYINAPLGANVADILGIKLWKPKTFDISNSDFIIRKNTNNNFYKFEEIDYLNNHANAFTSNDQVVITEKIDGIQLRVGWVKRNSNNFFDYVKANIFPYEFVIGSKEFQINPNKKNLWTTIVNKFNLKDRLKDLKGYIFYGEIYGGEINNMNYDLRDKSIRFFDVRYNDTYLDYAIAKDTVEFLGLEFVPLLYSGKFDINILDQLNTGESTIANHIKEGIIIKSMKETKLNNSNRRIFKMINPDYLLR